MVDIFLKAVSSKTEEELCEHGGLSRGVIHSPGGGEREKAIEPFPSPILLLTWRTSFLSLPELNLTKVSKTVQDWTVTFVTLGEQLDASEYGHPGGGPGCLNTTG